MKAKLIVTLGTRDLQIRPEARSKYRGLTFTDSTGRILNDIPRDQREFGEFLIAFGQEVAIEDLSIPMLEPACRYLKKKEGEFDLVLIATDQDKVEGQEKYWQQDSINIAKFIQANLKDYLGAERINLVAITGTNIQEMGEIYNQMRDLHFLDSQSVIAPNSITRFYVMPQGGLDSINTSLLLNGIEFYEFAVFLHKSEGQEEVSEQVFPRQYKQRLFQYNVDRLLESNQFFALSKVLVEASLASKLAIYAHQRYLLDHNSARQLWADIISKKSLTPFHISDRDKSDIGIPNSKKALTAAKMKDIYLSSKIDYENGDYSSALMKLYILQENFMDYLLADFLPPLNELFRPDLQREEVNQDWSRALNQVLALVGKKKIKYVNDYNPSANAYKAIWNQLVDHNQIIPATGEHNIVNNCWIILNDLKDIRNQLTHGGIGVSKELIDRRIKESTSTINSLGDLYKQLGLLYQVKGLGHFATIQKLIQINM